MARSVDDIMKDMVVEPPLEPVEDVELQAIVNDIDRVQTFLDQGLLRENEFTNLYDRASRAYEGTIDHDSLQYRKYDKQRRESPVWREVSRSGYVTEAQGYSFVDIRQQIVELLDMHNVASPQAKEIFLGPNSEYKALTNLRNVLSSAASSIDIRDDYLFTVNKKTKNINLLYLLAPYLETSVGLICRLHGAQVSIPSSSLDIGMFLKQYGEDKVQIRCWPKGEDVAKETHDRFIIIDRKTVYQIGASIKDLGMSQSSIIEVTSKDVKDQYIRQFDGWWEGSLRYSGE